MARTWRTTLLFLLLLLSLPALAQARTVTPRPHPPSPSESTTLRLINAVRREHGLRELRFRRDLFRAARWHSRDMATHGYFAHGRALARFLTFGGAGLTLFGENIAWGSGDQETPESAVARWMASPPHRANILDRNWRFIGVGSRLAHGYQGTTLARVYTVDFGA